jgi:GT2 family glycosyltransferase
MTPDPGRVGAALALVAIGRNEGERLRRCLASARQIGGEAMVVIYVDSGSDDDSLAIASAQGIEIVELDPAEGFTAARARNAGFAALKARPGGAPEFVHFVDGDCELVPGWAEAALARLCAAPTLAAVAGRRRERFPGASIFNRLCDMEWNTPVGPAGAVGGDAVYRVAAFAAAGGFDPQFICGEEPELCFRLRQGGWGIERLDHDMTLHDAAMTRWGQWRKRTARAGWAYAEGAATYGATPERYNLREVRRIWGWGAAAPGLLILALILAATVPALRAPGLILAALIALAAVAVALRAARWRRRDRGDLWSDALLYGVMVMLGKPFEALGALRYRLARARGERGRIIEYKGAGGGA